MVGNYYGWFQIDIEKKIDSKIIERDITKDLSDFLWIDGLQRQVIVRKLALPELIPWRDKIELELQNKDTSTNESDGREK